MDIKTAKYHKNEITEENTSILLTLNESDAEMSVPMDANNRHYAEILKQVADGDLTIADAD